MRELYWGLKDWMGFVSGFYLVFFSLVISQVMRALGVGAHPMMTWWVTYLLLLFLFEFIPIQRPEYKSEYTWIPPQGFSKNASETQVCEHVRTAEARKELTEEDWATRRAIRESIHGQRF